MGFFNKIHIKFIMPDFRAPSIMKCTVKSGINLIYLNPLLAFAFNNGLHIGVYGI